MLSWPRARQREGPLSRLLLLMRYLTTHVSCLRRSARGPRRVRRRRRRQRPERRGRRGQRPDDHAGAVQRAARAGEEELRQPEAQVPEGRHDRVQDAEEPGDGSTSSSARSSSRRPTSSASRSPTADVDKHLDADQEAVLRRQRVALPEAAQAAGPHRRRRCSDDIKAQLVPEKIFKKVTTNVKVTDADIKKYYNKHQTQYGDARAARRRAHPRQDRRRCRQALQRSQGRRETSRAREEVLEGSGLEGPGRQADDLEGPDRRAVRPGRVRAEDGRVSHPIKTQFGYHIIKALGADQAGEDDAVREGQGVDPPAASAAEEERRR